MNKYIKKRKTSYIQRGLYNRKLKANKFGMNDLMALYLPKNWESKVSITTFKN